MSERRAINVPAEAAGQRLDVFLVGHIEGVSRSRIQMLIDQGDVRVDGATPKARLKLRGESRSNSPASRTLRLSKPWPRPFRWTWSTKTLTWPW